MKNDERQAALHALNEADECFQPETLEELRKYFPVFRLLLSAPRVPVIGGLDEAIKETEYKYFGDYEMSKEQRDAVDKLVEAARWVAELSKTKASGALDSASIAARCVQSSQAAPQKGA